MILNLDEEKLQEASSEEKRKVAKEKQQIKINNRGEGDCILFYILSDCEFYFNNKIMEGILKKYCQSCFSVAI